LVRVKIRKCKPARPAKHYQQLRTIAGGSPAAGPAGALLAAAADLFLMCSVIETFASNTVATRVRSTVLTRKE
jgi:hypothetical protein